MRICTAGQEGEVAVTRRANGAKETDGEESHAVRRRGGRGGRARGPNEAVLITAGRTLNSSVGTKPGGVGVVSGHVGGSGGVKRLRTSMQAGERCRRWGAQSRPRQDHTVRSVGENGAWPLHEGNYGRVITPTVNDDSTGTKGRNKDGSQPACTYASTTVVVASALEPE